MKQLSRRETEAVTLLAQGLTNQEIATAMGLSVKTTETYRRRVQMKLGLTSRAGLFRYAVDAGILTSRPTENSPETTEGNGGRSMEVKSNAQLVEEMLARSEEIIRQIGELQKQLADVNDKVQSLEQRLPGSDSKKPG